ncbi:TIGR01459 family HAD-type hydrolase [Dyadobacter sediminis]|uniref:TIGR01459 family HAD-type hydrolase n=1 Tax=Dyadobacter sediminis TaxID=1493691 RepID=A0A5R9K843_9BACT|nr:TIGR01459 family HAD-type hydrolase [Dyadobacter sediminis]TLU89989.1 TIGR01459 family HAD-type hydrolase [Dyadobacter sediminis]GGC11104.1 haloacid dehalogenase [Dyadobacter sediminis]
MILDNFKSVISKYEVVFFDAFGVLKTYNGLIPGIENTFKYLKENGKDFYVVTNDASRSPDQLAESYVRLGINDITPDRIISSGMLAREYLELKVRNGIVAYLGTDNSAHYLETSKLKTVSIRNLNLDSVGDVSALVFLDDEGFDWNTDLTKTLNLLRKRNIPVIVANTDKTYPASKSRLSIAVGALAKMIEDTIGRQFIRFGKPDPQMFIFAYQHIKNYPDISKRDILMVGDTLHTDILGGNKFGLDTALVLTGNTQAEDAEVRIRSAGIIPTYICVSAVVD